tara:strand:+ start:600 stop:1220 length:621 start_codon:yes stop_codon:yes gene_type:complete
MATLNATNLKHASSGSNNIVLNSDGSTTISGNATCSGTATGFGGGKLLQVVQGGSNVASSQSVASKATADTGIQVSITPSSASSKILVIATISGAASAVINNWAMTLQKKTGSGSFASLTAANGAVDGNRSQSISGTRMDSIYSMYQVSFNFLDTAGSTDTLIYRAAYFNHSGGTRTLYINRSSDDLNNNDYTRGASWIQALEISA